MTGSVRKSPRTARAYDAATGYVMETAAVRNSSPEDVLLASDLAGRDAYRLMTDLIAPRPIAWVSTCAEDGRQNLAPFSYFQAVCSRPPSIVLGFGWHSDGRPKDTLRNILELREFTISHVDESVAPAMSATAASLGPDDSEWDHAGLEPVASRMVRPPRVGGAVAALECRLTHAIPLGQMAGGSPSSTLVVGEVQCFHVRAGLLRRDEAGRLLPMDPALLQSVGRMGGPYYVRTRDTFEMERP